MGETMLRFSMSPKWLVPSRPLGRRVGFGHVLHHGVAGSESADEERALVADHGGEPVVLIERVRGGAGAGFLAESEINSADDFALLVEIFERDFHFAVEQHEAVDLDGLLLAQILRVADGRDGSVEIAGDFVADVFGAVSIFFYGLVDGEVWVLEAVVGDGVGAEVLVGIGSRAWLDPADGGVRRSHESVVERDPLRGRLPLELALDFFLLFPMEGGAWARY